MNAAAEILHRLAPSHEAYFVGGAVRDLLLGREAGEFDVATSATPEEIHQIFEDVIDIGRAFGVCLVRDFGTPVEVATFRTESSYRDGRHPDEIEYAETALEDSERRDFTINAIYQDADGGFYDPQGGREDLRKKLVRAIGDPEERFTEDHVRMLRAVRFAAQLGFHIDQVTADAIAANAGKLGDEPGERISVELTKILTSGRSAYGLDLMKELGVLAAVLPSLDALSGVEQPSEFHPEGDVWIHTVMAMSHADALGVKDPATLLGLLLHDIGKARTYEVRDGKITFYGHEAVSAELAEEELDRLKVPRRVIDSVVWLVGHHMRLQDFEEMRPGTARGLLEAPDAERLLVLTICDRLASSADLTGVKEAVRALGRSRREAPEPPPLITGHDLLEVGVPEGPEIGRLLDAVEAMRRDGELVTREDAIRWVGEELKRGLVE